MQLKWPFMLALLLVPFGSWLWRRWRPRKQPPMFVAETAVAANLPSFKKRYQRLIWLRRVESLGLVLILVVATVLAARPQTAIGKVNDETSHDVVLALDNSPSMRSYLPAALKAMKDIVQKNPGDRYAIVVFAAVGYPVLALTRDTVAIEQQIDYLSGQNGISSITSASGQLGVGSATAGTNIGQGLLVSLQRFDHLDQSRSRSIVMISDLESDSANDYLAIAPLAPKYNVHVYAAVPGGSGDFGEDIFAQAQKSQFTALSGAKLARMNGQGSLQSIIGGISQQILNKDRTQSFVLADDPFPWLLLLSILVGLWSGSVLLRWGWR